MWEWLSSLIGLLGSGAGEGMGAAAAEGAGAAAAEGLGSAAASAAPEVAASTAPAISSSFASGLGTSASDWLHNPETGRMLAALGSALGKAGSSSAGNSNTGWAQFARGAGSLADSLGGGMQQAALYNKMAGVDSSPTMTNIRRLTKKADGSTVVDFHPPALGSGGNDKSKLQTDQPITQEVVNKGTTTQDDKSINENLSILGPTTPSVTPGTTGIDPNLQTKYSGPMGNQQRALLNQVMGGGQVPFLQALQRLQYQA